LKAYIKGREWFDVQIYLLKRLKDLSPEVNFVSNYCQWKYYINMAEIKSKNDGKRNRENAEEETPEIDVTVSFYNNLYEFIHTYMKVFIKSRLFFIYFFLLRTALVYFHIFTIRSAVVSVDAHAQNV